MPVTAEVEWVFPAAVVGTPPFEFGIHLHKASGALDLGELDDWRDTAIAAWEDNIRDEVWSGIGAGFVLVTGTDGSTVIESTGSVTAGGGSTQTLAPGLSFRAKVIAARPPGARSNASYIPLPDGGSANQEGVINPTSAGAIEAAGTDLAVFSSTADLKWVARHQVGGPTAPIDYRESAGWSVAATGSYLNRRYR